MTKTIAIFFPLALVLGEVLFHWSHFFPLTTPQTLTLFMALWMVVWWIFEVLPFGITALIPLIFLPTFQILPIKNVTPEYANHVIYLFLGGFMIAKALEVTRLNERIALTILRFTAHSDRGILLGFIVSTFFLSMWISNTATTVMMLPVATSVMVFLNSHFPNNPDLRNLKVAVLLSIAYSSSIGGIATPIGTPPNVVLVGYLDELFQQKIDFWRWTAAVLPIGLSITFFQYLLLNKLFPFRLAIGYEFMDFIKDKVHSLGAMDRPQKLTLVVFLFTSVLWICKDLLHLAVGAEFLNDTSIALLGGVLLFLIPVDFKSGDSVLKSQHIAQLPWNIILLFGGGMAMAAALESVGLIQMTTDFVAKADFSSPFILILALSVITVFLTEIMSNVALCVVILPVMMKLGVALGVSPVLVGLPVAICSSFGFAMPISTPPNAIVFGTNEIRVREMIKIGLWLNLAGIFCVMTVGWWLIQLLISTSA